MPDLFVAPPGWSWDIVLYFFIGGLTGGLYFVACTLRLVNPGAARALSRIGFYLAFPFINVAALLLVKDLGVPSRFWHMLFQSEELPAVMFKWWSPISFGSWIVALSGVVPLFSFVHALVEGGIWNAPGVRRITAPFHDAAGWLGKLFLAPAALLGLFLAGYTGLLLMVNNAPTWSHDPLLGPLFAASGVASGAAAIYLVARLTGTGDPAGRRVVLRTAAAVLAFETALLLAAVMLGIGKPSPFFLEGWAVLFWLVVLPFGFVAPLALLFMAVFRGRHLVPDAPLWGAALVLGGGLLLRVVEVFGGQAYFVPY